MYYIWTICRSRERPFRLPLQSFCQHFLRSMLLVRVGAGLHRAHSRILSLRCVVCFGPCAWLCSVQKTNKHRQQFDHSVRSLGSINWLLRTQYYPLWKHIIKEDTCCKRTRQSRSEFAKTALNAMAPTLIQ